VGPTQPYNHWVHWGLSQEQGGRSVGVAIQLYLLTNLETSQVVSTLFIHLQGVVLKHTGKFTFTLPYIIFEVVNI
jgi:hypothetical protein